MTQWTIYHNPKCSKSRQTIALLEAHGIEPNIVHYIETPPSAAQLAHLLQLMDIEPRTLMRSGEKIYKELKLDNTSLSNAELIQVMVENPVLIQRPIVTNGKKAAIGRPPEHVLQLMQ